MQECARVLELCIRRKENGNAVREACKSWKPGGSGSLFSFANPEVSKGRGDLHGIA